MQSYHNSAVLQFDSATTGNAAVTVPVTVRVNSTQALAVIYDLSEVAKANPTATDSKGNYNFKAGNGVYDIIISEGTANEVKLEKIQLSTLTGVSNEDLINDLSQEINFATVAEYKNFTTALPVTKRVYLADRDANFSVISGTGASTTFDIIASSIVSQSITLKDKSKITAWGVSNAGVLSDGALQAAVSGSVSGKLIMPDGTYNFSTIPIGIDSVELYASSKQRLNWTNVVIPTSNSLITEGKETILVACVVRWYDTTTSPVAPGADGYYTLFDAGEEHDPIFMSTVSASGSSSLIIDVDVNAFGLDANDWTPSGFVVAPDETLADSGVTFGASVSSTQVTIRGTYNATKSGFVFYDGANWQFSGNAYDNPIFSNGVLTITRPPLNAIMAAANYSASVIPVMRKQTAADWGVNSVYVDLFALSGDNISLIFTDINGDRVLTPDTRLKFWLTDSKLRNPDFNFGASPGGGTNIWMIGAFVKRAGFV